MLKKFSWVVALCLCLMLGPAWAADQAKVADAVKGGQQWLKKQQQPNGSWNETQWGGYTGAATGFAVAALIETGVPWNDPAVVAGINYLKSLATVQPNGSVSLWPGGYNTYNHGTALVALSLWARAQGDAVDVTTTNLIRAARNYSLSAQYLGDDAWKGSWSYSGFSGGDNSNTQFGVMGVWYANRFLGDMAGAQPWSDGVYSWLQHIYVDAGGGRALFDYQPGYGHYAGSMTGAGLWELAMIDKGEDPMATAAENWFSQAGNYRWDLNPGPSYNNRTFHYYFVYGMAKALAATVGSQNTLGPEARAWSTDLVNRMVDDEAVWGAAPANPGDITDCYWQNPGYSDADAVMCTAWVLMAIAFVDLNVPKKEAFLPDIPSEDFPIGGLITLLAEGGATISRPGRRNIAGANLPSTVTLPVGAMEFTLHNVPVGGQAVLAIKVPAEALNPANPHAFVDAAGNLKEGLSWFKIRNGKWKGMVPIVVDKVAQEIRVTLTDGGPEDDDGMANGEIMDPGAPGFGATEEAATTNPPGGGGKSICFITSLFGN